MIVPSTLLTVVVDVVVVDSGVVVDVVNSVVVEMLRDSEHCFHFSRTGTPQDQHPAPDSWLQESGTFA